MSDKLKVEVQATVFDSSGAELEKIVDEDIASFNDYFVSLGNDPVVNSERAILKTYLFFKIRVEGKRD